MIIITLKNIKPEEFIAQINSQIQAKEIQTWKVDEDGDYTAHSEQWNCKAWMHPKIEDNNTIYFGIIKSKKYGMSRELYGVYHGRFSATLLAHFDQYMESLSITPLLDKRADIC